MKRKNLLITAIAIFGLATITFAQTVPSYIPTSGLVGWWPFNGNANDESGNGNNGTVNGATLTTDRFNSLNAAYHLDGNGDNIYVANNFFDNGSVGWSLSVWYNLDQLSNPNNGNSNTYTSTQPSSTSSSSSSSPPSSSPISTSYYASNNGISSTTTNSNTNNSYTTYYGNNGGTANIITLSNGNQGIQVTTPDGNTIIYSQTSNPNNSGANNISSSVYYGSTGTNIPSNYNLAYSNSTNSNSTNNNTSGSSNTNTTTSSNGSSSNYQTILYGPNGAIAIANNSTNSVMIIQNGVSTNYVNQNPSQTNGQTAVFTSSSGGTIKVSIVNGQINLT